jgi:hypothetical protein
MPHGTRRDVAAAWDRAGATHETRKKIPESSLQRSSSTSSAIHWRWSLLAGWRPHAPVRSIGSARMWICGHYARKRPFRRPVVARYRFILIFSKLRPDIIRGASCWVHVCWVHVSERSNRPATVVIPASLAQQTTLHWQC